MLVAVFVIGLTVGFFVGVWSIMSAREKSIKHKVIEHKGVVYKLTEIRP